ncbi:MAG: CAP domain-containing protein [Sediminibacterium sp.]|nr:CAP domain-containing protein [Sediminibacterium sp.]
MRKPLLVAAFLILVVSLRAQLSEVELEVRPVPTPATRDAAVLEWNRSFPAFSSMNPREQACLYWVNLTRKNPVYFCDSILTPILAAFPPLRGKEAAALKKDLLAAGSLPMFSPNALLNALARAHATDISSKKATISHTSTNGNSFADRMRLAGINTCGGENISLGNQGVLLSVVLLYLDMGLMPAAHRQTLLSKQYEHIGLGCVDYGADNFFLVQDFSCKLNTRF